MEVVESDEDEDEDDGAGEYDLGDDSREGGDKEKA